MPNWSSLTPATEAAWQELTAAQLAVVAALDFDRLTLERSRLPDEVARKISEPIYSLKARFRFWERLVSRMANNWEPDGYYLIDEYVNDLESRDEIDRMVSFEPALRGDPLSSLIQYLDSRFEVATVEDGGTELQLWVPRLSWRADLSGRWYRKPVNVPWS
jgi:hypothetical protein